MSRSKPLPDEARDVFAAWRSAGWSGEKLAELVGVDDATIRKIGRDGAEFAPATHAHLVAWAEANPTPTAPPPNRPPVRSSVPITQAARDVFRAWHAAGWPQREFAAFSGFGHSTTDAARREGAVFKPHTARRLEAWAKDHQAVIDYARLMAARRRAGAKDVVPKAGDRDQYPDRRAYVEAGTRVVWPETAWRGLQAGRTPEELAAEHRTTPARITDLARRYELARQLGVARIRHHNLQEAS